MSEVDGSYDSDAIYSSDGVSVCKTEPVNLEGSDEGKTDVAVKVECIEVTHELTARSRPESIAFPVVRGVVLFPFEVSQFSSHIC